MQTNDLVLVTGGTGFLGGHCIVALLRKGYQVRTTVRDLARAHELRATIAHAVGEATNLAIVEADLGSDQGWTEAVSGSRYVLHTASPFPAVQPRNADELIAPARDGALRILRACLDAKVERVVLTSSSAAMSYPDDGTPDPVTEQYWTNPSHPMATPYVKSKVLAERAAWDFVASNQSKPRPGSTLAMSRTTNGGTPRTATCLDQGVQVLNMHCHCQWLNAASPLQRFENAKPV